MAASGTTRRVKRLICAIGICKELTNTDSGLSFYNFPKDPAIRKQWVHRCYRKTTFSAECGKVCSKHFLPEDFVKDLQSELLEGKTRLRLKRTAIPSLHLKPDLLPDAWLARERRQNLAKKRDRQKLVNELMQTYEEQKATAERQASLALEMVKPLEPFRDVAVQEDIGNIQLEGKITALEAKIKKLEVRDYIQKREIQRIKKMYVNKPAQRRIAREGLCKHFSTGQVDHILRDPKRPRWSQKDIDMGRSLHAISKNAYSYIRKNNLFPIPDVATLRAWKDQPVEETTIEDGNIEETVESVMEIFDALSDEEDSEGKDENLRRDPEWSPMEEDLQDDVESSESDEGEDAV